MERSKGLPEGFTSWAEFEKQINRQIDLSKPEFWWYNNKATFTVPKDSEREGARFYVTSYVLAMAIDELRYGQLTHNEWKAVRIAVQDYIVRLPAQSPQQEFYGNLLVKVGGMESDQMMRESRR